MKTTIGRYLIILFFTTLAIASASAQRYQVGDIVENFTLINRATNQEVSLYDMEGKVIFLEWFAHWCPFCQAAAGDIGSGIVDYYNDLGATDNGVEVMHVGLNLQGGAESQTQGFVNFYGIQTVLNDFDRAVSNRFQPSNQPIFAIINGVANSSSHQQWELLYTELGYGDLTAPIATFRAAINSVQAAATPPEITIHPTSESLESGNELSLSVTATSEETISYQWKRDGANIPNATNARFTLPDAKEIDAGAYSVTVTTNSGAVDSETATVTIIRGYLDSLIAQGVPEDQRGHLDDPDKDGIPNSFEFLMRTDANDPRSQRSPVVAIELVEDAPYLTLSYLIDPKIDSLAIQPEFSVSLDFSTDFLTPILHSESTEGELQRRTYRAQAPVSGSAHFARLGISSTDS
ncbi:MAG: thiol-disulfide isomerase/thioredoxin [Candidatus Pelagisphaera sp.]|jgi:thiol-disulfide isomerase/thioredoxin